MKLLDNRQMCFFPLKAYNDLFFIILRPRVKKDEETISVPSYVQCIVQCTLPPTIPGVFYFKWKRENIIIKHLFYRILGT